MSRSARATLDLPETASLAEARDRWRALVRDHHPDRGGDGARLAEINAAWDEIRAAPRRPAPRGTGSVGSHRPGKEEIGRMQYALARTLISRGYARADIKQRDLPGLHLLEEVRYENGVLVLIADTEATRGANLFVHPRLFADAADGSGLAAHPENFEVSEIEIERSGGGLYEVGRLRCRDGSTIPLRMRFADRGGTFRASAVKTLRAYAAQSRMEEAGRTVGRGKRILRRLAKVVGLDRRG